MGNNFNVSTFFTLIQSFFNKHSWPLILDRWQDVIFSLLIALSLSVLFIFAGRRQKMVPSGIQNFFEWFVERAEIEMTEILGEEAKRYLPFLGTLFIYIFFMNLLGLVPLMESPTSNLNITVAMAVIVFFLVQYLNFKYRGILGYFFYLAGSPRSVLAWMLSPILFFVDLLSQFTRPLTLAFRLFGNMFGEEILIGYFTLLGVAALAFFPFAIGLPFQLPFMLFAAFVSLLQAVVFTFLSAIYILLSVSEIEENLSKKKE